MRNRIYSYTVEEDVIKLVRGSKPKSENARISVTQQSFGLTQVCRSIRSEFLPLCRAHTKVSLIPQDLYDYIDTFLLLPGISYNKIVGSITLDLMSQPQTTTCVDIKPLLKLLRRAENLHVGTQDIIDVHYLDYVSNHQEPTIQEILASLYDIHDMTKFYDYVETAMSNLELEFDDAKGVEIVFELSPEYWEAWMGEWSKPDHDPDYRIPIELEDNVVQWGLRCGMELDRSMGSHLTVNFRCGK